MAAAGPSKLSARLEHRSPGRVRARVALEHRTVDALEPVRGHLASHPSVGKVTINHRTGSVLVEGPKTQALHSALDDVLEIFESGSPEQAEDAAVSQAVGAIRRMDQELSGMTGGRVSLRWLIPSAFIFAGVRQLVTQGLGVGSLPWFVLLYYGVDSFLKLYPEHAPKAPPSQPERKAGADAGA